MRKLAAVLGVAVALSLLTVPAAQAQTARVFVDVSPSPAYPDEIVDVIGRCRARRASVRIQLNDLERWAVLRAGRDGRYEFSKRLPRTISARTHTISAFCNRRFADSDTFRVKRRNNTAFNVEPERVRLGGFLRYQGAGCGSERIVRFYLGHRLLDSTLTRRDWFFRDSARVPSSLREGTYTAVARCRNGRRVGAEGGIVVVGDYPGPTGRPSTLGVATSRVTAGRTIAISARDCEDGVTEAMLDDTKLNLVAPARSGGIYNAAATVPAGTPAGTYLLRTHCDGTPAATATVQVVAAGQDLASTSMLPTRRTTVIPGISAGLALIVAGGLVLVSIRRRRSNTRT